MSLTFSVLMSVYKNDNPEHLKTALHSIYNNQFRKPNEIVITIDGPVSDKIRDTIHSFKQQNHIVKVIDLVTNRGLGEALRLGSQECTCDYIVRMDSDDISRPDRFEKQFDFLEKHPNIDILGCNILEFESDPDKPFRQRVCPENHRKIAEMAKSRSPMNHITTCIKRTSLLASNGYLPMPYAEDYYLWVRMLNNAFIFHNLQENLVLVRVGNGMTARRSNIALLNSLKIIYNYLYKNKMITSHQYLTNLIKAQCFIRSPNYIKTIAYKYILRKKSI